MWPAELANHTRQSVGRHRSRSIVFQLAQSDIGELTLAPAQGQLKDYTGPVRRLVGACHFFFYIPFSFVQLKLNELEEDKVSVPCLGLLGTAFLGSLWRTD